MSTAFSLLAPLALAAAGAFAFYKIVLEGRGSAEIMADEVAETSSLAAGADAGGNVSRDNADDIADEAEEARERLSAVEQARSEFFDKATPAEEILAQIQSRKQRLQEDDET